jgi:hypothetical protein
LGVVAKGLRRAELKHRSPLSSSIALLGILGPIAAPATDFQAFEVADVFHGRAVGAQPVGNDDLGTAVALHDFLEKFKTPALCRLLLTKTPTPRPRDRWPAKDHRACC